MKQIYVVTLLSPLFLLLPGCEKPQVPPPPIEKKVAAANTSSIVIDIGEQLTVYHEAQPGQMLLWKANSSKTPNFWIQFAGTSPCTNGVLVLSGSVGKAASCVAGSAKGGSGTIIYSYFIRATPPPQVPAGGITTDVFGRCEGCNN